MVPLKNRAHYEVLKTINVALRQAKKEEFVLIYYSGHGKLDRAGRLYLAATDTEVEALEATSIPVATILDYIRLSSCRNVGLILDCCYSGAVGDSIFKGGVEEQFQQASSSSGVYILTASTGVQVAEEKEKDENGLLTKHIIQGIESGEADLKEDGNVSMDELYEYVHRKVTQEGFQEPMKWDLGVKGELIVARSGKTPRQERRKQMRQMMLDYAREGQISDRLLTAALNVLKLGRDELHGEAGRRDDLLRQLWEKRLPLGEFLEEWYASGPVVVATPAPQDRPVDFPLPTKSAPVVVTRTQQAEPPGAGAVKTDPSDGQPYVWIPPGEFQLGCSDGDKACRDNEKPAVKVLITRGFWLGQTPVTQAAFERVMNGANPSKFKGQDRPVERVTWDEARQYCELVGGRLPTEAEWEYAARAGTRQSRYGDLAAIAWYDSNSDKQTHPVGRKDKNAWGLYDMLGNVWEWVADWYQADYYKTLSSPAVDPKGPATGTSRVLRGGSWFDGSRYARALCRYDGEPGIRYDDVGFRCAREVIITP